MTGAKCECGVTVEGADLAAYSDAFLAHVRAAHPDWPYPDVAVRNFGEGLVRMTGSTERLASLGEVEVHVVAGDRIEDWASFFDHDAFAGFPQWSACYCAEPHRLPPDAPPGYSPPWQENREAMLARLRAGTAFGYLAYVDGRPAGWVNASTRCDYTLFRRGDDDDERTIGVACFCIAPPYRGHGIAATLLDRVVGDAASRGATWVEAYPFNEGVGADAPNFRGARGMYDERGFTEVKVRTRDTVVRRPTAGEGAS